MTLPFSQWGPLQWTLFYMAMGFLAGIFGVLWTDFINNYLDERDKKRGIPINYRNRLIDGIVIIFIMIIIIFVVIFFAPAGI